MEKAWAKLHGSYCRTEGGQTSHAAAHLLGTPCLEVKHSDYDPD